MDNKNIEGSLKELFRTQAIKIQAYLPYGTIKGANYDPYRKTGKEVQKSNAIYIKAIVRDVQPEKLILKEMGLTIAGAKELIILDKDINFIKLSEKMIINGEEYYKYHDALGNKFLIFDRPFGLKRIIVFKKKL